MIKIGHTLNVPVPVFIGNNVMNPPLSPCTITDSTRSNTPYT